MTTPSLPTSIPYAFGGASSLPSPDRLRFADAVWRIGPPWLQRSYAVRFLSALAQAFDDLTDRAAAAVRLRFPVWSSSDALVYLGRERGIRRGPVESSHVYAARLLRWWDDHRGRGGPYALLRQLAAYWAGTGVDRLDVVNHNGVRRILEPLDAATIPRDVVAWGADGTADWAQVWIFFHLAAAPSTPLTADEEAERLLVALEWVPAHVFRTHVVLLWGAGRLWDYLPPSGTWDAWASGGTWDAWDAEAPITITHTEG